MKLLEVRTALKRATKEDLFTGEIYKMHAKQGIKDNTTVFYRDLKTGQFQGPHTLFSNGYFAEIYAQMSYGMIGVIVPMPNVVTNEILFDLVLREASIDDLKDTPRHIKLNRIYYTYDSHILLGPSYTDNSTTSLYLENLVAKNHIFVPNERQHFKKREMKKVA
jgi:hypothetical protein